jgi:hypothetical protein
MSFPVQSSFSYLKQRPANHVEELVVVLAV